MRFRLLLWLALLVAPVVAQDRYESGPYKGFVRENPQVTIVEMPEPLRVSVVRGSIVMTENRPISEAYFEIRDDRGRIYTSITDEEGRFHIARTRPGTYTFKATKDGFESTIGTIVVSPRSKNKQIQIQLHLGT